MNEIAFSASDKKVRWHLCVTMVLMGIFSFALDTSAQTRFARPGAGVNLTRSVAVTVEKGVLGWAEDLPREGQSPEEYLERRPQEEELRAFFEFMQPEHR